jgi:hypothetical protein
MNKFSNLMAEADALRQAWGYDLLDSVQYIMDHRQEYPIEIRLELCNFLIEGARLFAPVEN